MGPLPSAPGCDCHICRPDAAYDPYDRQVIDTVLAHGWQVLAVSDDGPCSCPDHEADDHHDDSSDEPAFAYTVGLGHRRGHPELLMSGLDPQLMHRALNDVAARVMKGRRLAPGDVLEGVLGGVPVVVERVATEALDRLQPPSWREPFTHVGAVAADPPWAFPVPPDRMAFSCTHVVDDGESILWVARESHPERGEDWSLHCGAGQHTTDDMCGVHLAHLVRSAPSVAALAGLGLDEEAWRDDVDADWQVSRLA